MATKPGRMAVFYWGSATAVPIAETRNLDVNLGADMLEDTAHGDATKTYIPGLLDFGCRIEKLYDDAVYTLIDDALARSQGYFYIYPDRETSTTYFYGQGYVTMESLATPFADLATEGFRLVASGAVTFQHA